MQSSASSNGSTGLAGRLAAVNLRVRDLPASAAFFRSVFGCVDAKSGPTSRDDVLRLRLGGEGSRSADVIALIADRPISAHPSLNFFSIEMTSAADVDRVHQRAHAEGARVAPPRTTDGLRRCLVFDPDGHKIEVFATCNEDNANGASE